MAIVSMTGFGRSEAVSAHDESENSSSVVIAVEMKSVNNRFLDVSCKLPPMLQRVEPEIQKLVRQKLRRGRVDVFVSRNESSAFGASVAAVPVLNEVLFRASLQALENAFRIAGVQSENIVRLEAAKEALSMRGVLDLGSIREPDFSREIPLVLDAASKALEEMRGMRMREGGALEQELTEQLSRFEGLVDVLSAQAALAPQQFQERLNERIVRLVSNGECEPQRLAQEVALLVDRADVTEELTRLRSHIQQFRDTLSGEEGGKKLEFLLQEMGREVNTTGSKSQSSEIASAVVEAKLILERVREQVLNVE